jgi:Site-specific recombinase XerD
MAEKLSSLVDAYLQDLRHGRRLSEHTVTNYAVDLAQFVEFALVQGLDSPEAIRSAHVRAFLREMLAYGYAKASVARKLSAVKSWMVFSGKSRCLQRIRHAASSRPSFLFGCRGPSACRMCRIYWKTVRRESPS